jgi:hypothetical protein
MTHLDEGRIRAFLDGESGDDLDSVRRHLEECGSCSDLLAQIEARSVVVERALGLLDTVGPNPHARDRVRAMVETESPIETRTHADADTRISFAKAAVIVLFLAAGGAAALPSSPVRAWLAERVRGGASAIPESTQTADEPAPVGVRLDVETGALAVSLVEVEPGTLVIVRWVEGTRAAALAGTGARFRAADGRIEVTAVSDSISVDLPLDVAEVSLEVNGRMYLRKMGERLDVAGPVITRSPEEIRLRVP